jgi:potassium efflux system protein
MQTSGKQGPMTGENRLRLILIVILIAVIVGVTWGLRYSVSIITSRLVATLWIGVGLLILHNLLESWLYFVRRRLYHAERQAAYTEQSIGEAHSTIAEKEADLVNIGAETRRLLNATTMSATVVVLLYLWTPLFPVVDALTRVTLWTSTTVVEGESVTTLITLKTLVLIIFLAAITFYAARRLPALVELALRSRTSISPGGRYTASTLLSYGIVAIGAVIALSALGLRWSQLQWLIAALGIGIGFGLQEIIANFISGLIILFERPIRVGDIVTVGDKDGTVTKIRIRATTILDFDGRELLVPNKEFITGRLLNWTLSDSTVRLVIPVGIAYGSDVEEALRILEQITNDYPGILADPEPSIIIENFGDNALELSARFFIDSFDDYWPVMTNVRSEIYKRFAEAGIAIAFPQRDVHFDSEQPIRISIDARPDD